MPDVSAAIAEAYRVAVGAWYVQPSEFWRMCPAEWWWLYDARVGEPRYGTLTETECAEFYNLLN